MAAGSEPLGGRLGLGGVFGHSVEMSRRPTGPERARFSSGVVILLCWFVAAAGPCTFFVADLNHIDCGSKPVTCEPGVSRAAIGGVIAQGILFVASAGALTRLMRRQRLRAIHWLAPVLASVVVLVVAYNFARSAVDAQYGLTPASSRSSSEVGRWVGLIGPLGELGGHELAALLGEGVGVSGERDAGELRQTELTFAVVCSDPQLEQPAEHRRRPELALKEPDLAGVGLGRQPPAGQCAPGRMEDAVVQPTDRAIRHRRLEEDLRFAQGFFGGGEFGPGPFAVAGRHNSFTDSWRSSL